MNVKLINTPKLWRDTFPPYGLGVLNKVLNDNSINSDIIDLDILIKHEQSIGIRNTTNLQHLRENYDKIYLMLKLNKPNFYLDQQFERMIKKIPLQDVDVVGINSHDDEIYISLYLAKKIKEKIGCTVIVGGTHIQRFDYGRIQYFIDELNIDYVDYMVKQQPFEVFLKLAEQKIPEHTKKAEVFPPKNEMQDPLSDNFKYNPAKFGMPKYNKESIQLYKMDIKKMKYFYPKLNEKITSKLETLNEGKPPLVLSYMFTQGCTNNCAFCFAGMMKPYKLELDSVIQNIKDMQKEYKCDNFYFLNNNIIMDQEYAMKLFKRIKDETGIKWSDAASIKGLNNNILKTMSESGCIQLLFGLESASPKMLKYVHKNVDYNSLDYYTKCFEECNKNNIWVVADMIGGLPYETDEDINNSLDYLKKAKELINGLFLLRFRMYKDSQFYNNQQKYGIDLIKEEELRKNIKAKYGEHVDVYRKIYYRDTPFNEEHTCLNWEQKQKQIKNSSSIVQEYIKKEFQNHFYVHYPIFYLYNLYKDKKEILNFLKS